MNNKFPASPIPARSDATLYEKGFYELSDQYRELDRKASEAVEAMLQVYLDPDAFTVLKRFQWDFDASCGGVGMTLLEALNELGAPDADPIAQLQRTLKAIKKERKAA